MGDHYAARDTSPPMFEKSLLPDSFGLQSFRFFVFLEVIEGIFSVIWIPRRNIQERRMRKGFIRGLRPTEEGSFFLSGLCFFKFLSFSFVFQGLIRGLRPTEEGAFSSSVSCCSFLCCFAFWGL